MRRDFYLELVEFLQLLELWMERTEPIVGPAPEPPELPSDDAEGLRRLARLTVFASSAVTDATNEFAKKWSSFRWQYEALRQIRAQLGSGEQERAQWLIVEQIRNDARKLIRKVDQLVHDELASP